jgi:hypothetical protein
MDANLNKVRNNTSRSIIYKLQESFKMNPNKLFLVVFYTIIVNFGRVIINLLDIHYLFLNASANSAKNLNDVSLMVRYL